LDINVGAVREIGQTKEVILTNMRDETMDGRYLASLCINNVSIFDGFGDDLPSLIARFTAILTGENTQSMITIKDRRGDVVYQSRKVAGE
jgi:hypothetical protein